MTLPDYNPTDKPLPPGWKWVKLGEVCQVILGQSPPGSTYRAHPEGLPFFQGKADFGEISPVPRVWCIAPKKIAEAGDLLISVRAPVGPTNIAKERCAIGRGLAILRTGDRVNRDFLLAYLKKFESFISQMGSGSTFNAITGKQLITLPVPLPPLPEQQRIVTTLDRQMAAVEKARLAAEEMLENISSLKNAILRELLPSLGQQLPRGWKWVKLGEVADAVRGVTFPAAAASQEAKPEHLPCLTTSAIQEQVDWNTKRYIPQNLVKSDRQLLRCGDILVSTANSKAIVGKSCLVEEVPYQCSFGAFVTVLRPYKVSLPEWVFIALNTSQAKEFFYNSSSNTTNISNLRVSDLLSYTIALPPIAEQRRIMAALDLQMAAVGRAEDSARRQLADIRAMPAALLRQAFDGARA